MSQRSVQYFTVSDAEAGQKLIACLKRRLGQDLPDGLLHRIIRGGEVRVNGKRSQPFSRLEAGDEVRVPPLRLEKALDKTLENSAVGAIADATFFGLDIVAETPEYLILNKPAGLAAQPGSGHTDSLSSRLAAVYAGAEFTPTPAHRLDKATSGLTLAAKTYRALAAAQEGFRERTIHKDYLAWVEGDWPHPGPTELHDLLGKQDVNGLEKVITGAGKIALCTVRPLLRQAGRTLLRVRLHTGRTHQIRVQLASRGHPIAGDVKYGGQPTNQGMCLHAWRLMLPDGQIFSTAPPWKNAFAVDSEILNTLP